MELLFKENITQEEPLNWICLLKTVEILVCKVHMTLSQSYRHHVVLQELRRMNSIRCCHHFDLDGAKYRILVISH
jgi:hypothetical protein